LTTTVFSTTAGGGVLTTDIFSGGVFTTTVFSTTAGGVVLTTTVFYST
jgi:hypothetical protein